MKLTEDEIANVKTNMAILLVDVADGMLLDAKPVLERFGMTLEKKFKSRWRNMMDSFKGFKDRAHKVASSIYTSEYVDEAVADSDEWQEVIEMIADRIGEDKQRQKELFNFLKQYDSIYGITD